MRHGCVGHVISSWSSFTVYSGGWKFRSLLEAALWMGFGEFMFRDETVRVKYLGRIFWKYSQGQIEFALTQINVQGEHREHCHPWQASPGLGLCVRPVRPRRYTSADAWRRPRINCSTFPTSSQYHGRPPEHRTTARCAAVPLADRKMNRSPSTSGLLPLPGAPSSSWALYRARLLSIFRHADTSVIVAFWLFGTSSAHTPLPRRPV